MRGAAALGAQAGPRVAASAHQQRAQRLCGARDDDVGQRDDGAGGACGVWQAQRLAVAPQLNLRLTAAAAAERVSMRMEVGELSASCDWGQNTAVHQAAACEAACVRAAPCAQQHARSSAHAAARTQLHAGLLRPQARDHTSE